MAPSCVPIGSQQPTNFKLLQVVRLALRRGRYSHCTEQSYLHWIRRFVRFHDRRHPSDMGAAEVTAFLNHLAVERSVAAGHRVQDAADALDPGCPVLSGARHPTPARCAR